MSWMSKIFRRSSKDLRNQSATERNAGVPHNSDTSNVSVAGDNPIRRAEDDTLGRGCVARSFAREVLAVDAREGVVVGVLGAWGSGKTSFINLARDEFKSADVPVLDFNPWMFSGAQQLVESFFVELAAQLRIRPGLADVGKNLQEYGEAFSGMAWLPLVGPWIERGRGLAKIVSEILQRRTEGVGGRRAKLQKALADLSKPIVVVVDDIDRLSTWEIRDVFKLVRLTASFPNVIYLVAFDRGRVEKALAEEGVPGRDYLEKILQVALDLPAIPDHVLIQQIFSAIDAALATVEKGGPFDEHVWPDVFMEIIRPLMRNMRDVRRYAAAIHGTVGALNGQIALCDVLALEAIRVFLPDVFARLHGAVDALTTTSGLSAGGREEAPRLKSQIDGLINDAGAHGNVVRDMVERLFPAGQRHIGGSHYGGEWKGQWLKERRVAHEEILRFYLERVAGNRLQAFTDAEEAWARMADRDALSEYLRSLNRDRLQDVIASLEIYEDQFVAEQVVPGATVLLNLIPELPERLQGMFDLGGRVAVTRVTYRLLRSLNDPAAVEAAVRQILPELKSLSVKFELIGQVGHREGWGHKLVSEMAAADFEKAWRSEVRATPIHDLAKEPDLLRVLLITKRDGHEPEPALKIPDAPELTLAILRAARSEVRSQTVGSRAVHRSPRLGWDALVELYDNEDTLKKRIERLMATRPKGADDLLELAEKYRGGWRPSKFGDD
jgi:predicted KAP-like P-loop ATPase